jgi:hypothetical protein
MVPIEMKLHGHSLPCAPRIDESLPSRPVAPKSAVERATHPGKIIITLVPRTASRNSIRTRQ